MAAITQLKKRVLLVEDSRDARKSLRWLLETWGYAVQEAEDGWHGVREALNWHPQVAIVDIGLPILDGYEVARQVREALHDDIFLIALTAYQQPEDIRRAEDAGFNVHMGKPADLDELEKLLASDAR